MRIPFFSKKSSSKKKKNQLSRVDYLSSSIVSIRSAITHLITLCKDTEKFKEKAAHIFNTYGVRISNIEEYLTSQPDHTQEIEELQDRVALIELSQTKNTDWKQSKKEVPVNKN